MARGLVFAVCLFGCLKEPKFQYRDAAVPNDDADSGGGPEVTAMLAGTGAVISGSHFRMTFSTVGGHGPDSLSIGGTEVLGRGPNCTAERRLGLALFPSLMINDEVQPGAAPQPPLSVRRDGPLVAQVSVPFTHTVTCGANTATISGSMTYTAFPDGRIVRHDDIEIAGTIPSTACPTCPSGTSDANFYLTTFATLLADAGGAVTGFDVTNLPTGMDAIVPSESTFCTNYLDKQITVSFLSSGSDPGNRVRAVSDDPARTLVLVHDIVRSGNDLDPADSRDISTTMLLGQNGSCVTDHARARVLSMRPQVMIAGALVAPNHDGIYGHAMNGPLGLPVGPIDLTPFNMPLPAGFAFWLELGAQDIGTTTVKHSKTGPMTAPAVRMQRVGTSEVILYFRDPLALGDRITITPGP